MNKPKNIIRQVQRMQILKDLQKKMVFLVGPRQVGKTYLAKEIMKGYKAPEYLNYDNIQDKIKIKKMSWLPDTDLLILDELHKMPKWKSFLKGVFDTRNPSMHILVTGSAKLETYKKTGDSLAGRFFLHHILPVSLEEWDTNFSQAEKFKLLFERGGFPEPLFSESEADVSRWRKFYIDSLIRKEIVDLGMIENVKAIEDIFNLLRTKVGSQISYSNIAGDVGVSVSTVKRYIGILESLYVVYLIRPHSHKVGRSILKEPKVYFYDTGLLLVDESKVFENLIANALLKNVKLREDLLGEDVKLAYVRNKEKREVDFAIIGKNNLIEKLIEVKLSETDVDKSLKYFTESLNVSGVQVVKNIRSGSKVGDKIEIREVIQFLLSSIFHVKAD